MDLLNTMEYFFTDIFESQKDLDLKVYVEASPKNIFKKKDYEGNIKEYKRLKNLALQIDTEAIEVDQNDYELMELFCMFDEMLALYNLYTDRGIAVQDFLRRKAAGEKPANSEYKDVTTKQKSTAAAFSRSYNDLSVAYADYIQRRSEEA